MPRKKCLERSSAPDLLKVEPIYIEIGRLIRQERRKAGLTQEQLAAGLEMSRTSVVNIERGRQRVLVHILYDIAEVLDCLPGDLAPKPKLVQRDIIRLSRKHIRLVGDM
jgi:transcriptional regulator with XRE-family HTH domain